MRPHTEVSYQEWREFNERTRQGAAPETFELAGIPVEYTTVYIPVDQRPFTYAVASSLPEGRAEYEIAVSDEVPHELRGVWAWHEYYAFRKLGFDADNRCVQAEKVVAQALDGTELYAQYLLYRIPFYKSLARFIAQDVYEKGEASEYSILDAQACYKAMDYLEDAVAL